VILWAVFLILGLKCNRNWITFHLMQLGLLHGAGSDVLGKIKADGLCQIIVTFIVSFRCHQKRRRIITVACVHAVKAYRGNACIAPLVLNPLTPNGYHSGCTVSPLNSRMATKVAANSVSKFGGILNREHFPFPWFSHPDEK